jgi:prepilin-type processing-associated H-X9-DG protein
MHATGGDDIFGRPDFYHHPGVTKNVVFADGHVANMRISLPCYSYGRGGDLGNNLWPNQATYNKFWFGKHPVP